MAEFRIQKVDDHTLSLSGVVDVNNAMALKAEGEKLLKAMGESFVIDMSDVQQSSSVGVSVILCWVRAAREAQKEIQFRNMPAKMFDVARVSGLDEVLPLTNE